MRHVDLSRRAFCLLAAAPAFGAGKSAGLDDPLLGRWLAADSDHAAPYATVEFVLRASAIGAVVRELPGSPEAISARRCHASCPGAKAGQPMLGLEVVWGLQRLDRPGVYGRGTALDPEDGTLYRCEAELSSDGQRLGMLFFVGMRLLGIRETWRRPA